MLSNRKAQAVLELAILGSLIIMAFSIVISYSERYNREQSYMQQTFRATLKRAKEINNSARWTTTDFRRMPNVTNPMEIGELQQFGSGNSVFWSDGKLTEADQPKAYFELNRINEVEIPIRAGLYNVTAVSNSNYTSNLNSTTDFDKTENPNITTHKKHNATDNIVGSADVDGTTVSLNSSLFGDNQQGGTYTGGGLKNRNREMR
ncbi:MAG: hypothetical protein Q8N80_06295 [Candidatus Omnitrophota bacterium]|nr:hypothetical protein [Candidatus Omnitrophota bacterium]